MRKRWMIGLLCLLFCMNTVCGMTGFASDWKESPESVLLQLVQSPGYGMTGGEWTVFALARSGIPVPDGYYDQYYENLVNVLNQTGGILHEKKYTEYSRTVLALSAIGKNPADVAGYNLLLPIADFNKTVWQGPNGAAYALLALDAGQYDIPENRNAEIQATRDLYINALLSAQSPDGGIKLGDVSDFDVTAMAVQALAKYQSDSLVADFLSRAALWMKTEQSEHFTQLTCEQMAQYLVAACELKAYGNTALFDENLREQLMAYQTKNGGFCHKLGDGEINMMSTEQAVYALVAWNRLQNGKPSLYSMTDVEPFVDMKGLAEAKAIEMLSKNGVINGKTATRFCPNDCLTRAEYAAITVRALMQTLPDMAEQPPRDLFDDVPQNAWYAGYVSTAYRYGLIQGVSETEFQPDAPITREAASVLMLRAANLCQLPAALLMKEKTGVLLSYPDWESVSDWARDAVFYAATCDLLESESVLRPKENILRREAAYMIYGLLEQAAER